MLELVRGYATATFDGAERAERIDAVARDLVEMSRLLINSEALRGAITDASIPALDRRAVIEDLLGERVAPEALAAFLYALDTERASEIPKSLDRLVEMAEIRAARAAAGWPLGGEPPVGRSGAYERLRGFADRVFEQQPDLAHVAVIEEELFRVARAAESSLMLREVLANNELPMETRLAVLADVIAAQVRRETSWLAGYVVRAGRARDFVGGLDYLVVIAAAERGRRVAHVRSAVALEVGERQRLAEALSRRTRRPVELRVRIDPAVIGGLIVSVGDTLIDGTVKSRLERLRDSLLQTA